MEIGSRLDDLGLRFLLAPGKFGTDQEKTEKHRHPVLHDRIHPFHVVGRINGADLSMQPVEFLRNPPISRL